MKCHKHYEKDAVSQCKDCGRALCPACTNKYSIPICDGCNLKRVGNDKKVILRNSVLMIVFFIIGFIFYNNTTHNIPTAIVGGYLFAGIPWGWSFLSRLTPNVFVFLPIIGWLIYFLVKFALALCIGIFITPYKIYKIISGYLAARRLENHIKNNAA